MKKLAIVGTAPSFKLAPYNNPHYEVWGLNGLYTGIDVESIDNITRWFEIHSLEAIEALRNDHHYTWGVSYPEWLQAIKIPLIMQEVFPEYPTSVKYPFEEILRRFPRKYFTNSVSWMLALAIYEGYEDISIFGVDMAQGSEYSYQRPSCEYFIGYAEGLGIKVHIPDESDLLKTPFLYGFEDEKKNFMRVKLLARKQELEQKKAEVNQQLSMATATLNTYDGALQDVEYILGVWL